MKDDNLHPVFKELFESWIPIFSPNPKEKATKPKEEKPKPKGSAK